jgi:hypothetical protein
LNSPRWSSLSHFGQDGSLWGIGRDFACTGNQPGNFPTKGAPCRLVSLHHKNDEATNVLKSLKNFFGVMICFRWLGIALTGSAFVRIFRW